MKTMNIKAMTLIVCSLMLCMQAKAEFSMLEMQSTSAMQGTGSIHQSQIIAVEAPQMQYTYLPMQSTSTMMETGYIPTPFADEDPYSGHPGRPRRSKEPNEDVGDTNDESSPVGEPWVMLLFAAAAGTTIAIRRRRIVAEG